jgi:dihydrofolate reductase
MSTLTIDLFSSLDGYGAADGWPGYWGKEGPELMAWLEGQLAEDHTIVMGGNTYRTMSRIVAEEEDPSFARMAEIPKVVFSKTLAPPLTWDNTQVLNEEPAAALRRMKAEGSAPIRTLGSISLNKSLLRLARQPTTSRHVTQRLPIVPTARRYRDARDDGRSDGRGSH